jgi:hypothetical protein
MTTLSKQKVCQLLHISATTLWRRIKAGTYTCTRGGDEQFSSLSFTYADIGLPEPQTIAEPMPVIAEVSAEPTRNPPPSKVSHYEDADELPADDFAERYKAGEATDSSGNKIDGTNNRWSETPSLLGPTVPYEGPPIPRTGTAHMDARLLSDYVDPNFAPLIPRNPQDGEGFTRGGQPLAHGLTQEAYDESMKAWQRSGGGRSESEMEISSRRAVSNVNRSFPRK